MTSSDLEASTKSNKAVDRAQAATSFDKDGKRNRTVDQPRAPLEDIITIENSKKSDKSMINFCLM